MNTLIIANRPVTTSKLSPRGVELLAEFKAARATPIKTKQGLTPRAIALLAEFKAARA